MKRNVILTCDQKPTWVRSIYSTEQQQTGENRKSGRLKTDMLRSIGKQSGESVESVQARKTTMDGQHQDVILSHVQQPVTRLRFVTTVIKLIFDLIRFDVTNIQPSVLWRCWLGCRKGIRPVKHWAVGCWCGYLSGARCRLAQLMPLPLTVSCFSKIQIGFTFLVPAHPGSSGKRAVKQVWVM